MGGGSNNIPLFEPANSPFIPRAQKETEMGVPPRNPIPTNPKVTSGPPPDAKAKTFQQNNKPILDFTLYQQTEPPKSTKPKVNPVMYAPIQTQTPFYPPQFSNPAFPYYGGFYGPQLAQPVIKQYSINNGPFTNYMTAGHIKEDTIPPHLLQTMSTLSERLGVFNFLRSVFFQKSDGSDINLDGNGSNNLPSMMKFMKLNPYSKHANSMNPYRGLPDNLIIYQTCYPQIFDDKTGTTQCSPRSIGINVKIYGLTKGEYNVRKTGVGNHIDFEVWRELAYYEFIREQVIKTHISPNFPILYGYYISENCNIDFDKVKKMKGSFVPQSNAQTNILCDYSGKGLVSLIESATTSLCTWATRSYKVEGNVQRMVNTGYHSSEIWKSVLFQMIEALYVLQLKGIAFEEFDHRNVFIKEVNLHDNIVTYWKHNISGFDFYVPNYGYVVLIDSTYDDINDSSLLYGTAKKKHKIYASMFGDDNTIIKDKCWNAFLNIINPSVFGQQFVNDGGTKPPDEIVKLMTNIFDMASKQGSSKNIMDYLIKWFGSFMNNRIGTYLSENEIKNIQQGSSTPFKQGQIIVEEVQNQMYKFVSYFDSNGQDTLIFTKNNPKDKELIVSTVSRSQLFSYSPFESIVQNYKPLESNLNESEMLESYNL